MAVQIKNATVDVALPEGQADVGPSVTRRVFWQQSTGQVAYESFTVEVSNPFLIMDDPEAIIYYAEGGRVFNNGIAYSIKAPPRLCDDIPQCQIAAHIEVLLDQIRTSNAGVPEVAPR